QFPSPYSPGSLFELMLMVPIVRVPPLVTDLASRGSTVAEPTPAATVARNRRRLVVITSLLSSWHRAGGGGRACMPPPVRLQPSALHSSAIRAYIRDSHGDSAR